MLGEQEVGTSLHRDKLEFETLQDEIGVGSYSIVRLVRDQATNEKIALKEILKLQIVKLHKVEAIRREKDCLLLARGHPNIVKLKFTFQDSENLYFGFDYCENGSLLTQIQKHKGLDIKCVSFYAAELLSAICHLHTLSIIHRDIKPENLLLDATWRLKLADFGCAKIVDDANRNRASSFVGTAEYLPPELLQSPPMSSFWYVLSCRLAC